jgi:hypothetical protein
MKPLRRLVLWALLLSGAAQAQSPQVVDLPTRSGVTLRMLVQEPPSPASVLVLISGGAGQLDIASNGFIRRELDMTALRLPVLVVHHQQDPCGVCAPAQLPELMKHLPAGTPLHMFSGGQSRGAPCDPFSHHGFNGIEDRVVEDVSGWIKAQP